MKRSHHFKKTSSVYLQCQSDTEYVPSPNYWLHKPRSLHTHTSLPNTLWYTSQLEWALGSRGQLTNDNTRRRPSISTEGTRDRQTPLTASEWREWSNNPWYQNSRGSCFRKKDLQNGPFHLYGIFQVFWRIWKIGSRI